MINECEFDEDELFEESFEVLSDVHQMPLGDYWQKITVISDRTNKEIFSFACPEEWMADELQTDISKLIHEITGATVNTRKLG